MDAGELGGWLRLALPGVGNEAARRLLAAFGLPQAVLAQSQDALAAVVGSAVAQRLHATDERFDGTLQATLAWLASADTAPRHVLTLADARYPKALLQLADPPLVLYATGDLPAAWPGAIAIVGSRNPTAQGLANAREFAACFARAGVPVVSGLALGIDGAAHEGALEGARAGELATIAVVGTGPDRVYPKQHRELAHRIAAHGVVLSEYPVGTPPLAPNFPKRNRLIAALSEGTLVVEAALESGSLITARQAAEQGREVFAIPGSIHSPQSRGCHALIRQGAKLVETAQDVLEELPQLAARADFGTGAKAAMSSRDPDTSHGQDEREEDGDARLLAALGFDPSSLDALCARMGADASTLQAKLLELELQGEVARLPGGWFQRIARA